MTYFYHDNPQLRSAIDCYFAELSEYNRAHFGGDLSIILLGSLSRGEATWIQTQTGPAMVSDIEFFTVYPEGFTQFREFDDAMESAAKKAFPEQTSALFHIDNTYLCRRALPYMERKLLTYDAKMMGKTVMGQDDVPLLPQITLENINLQDIRDILTHRVFSVLYYGLPLKAQGNDVQYRYSLAKNSLDLMTVLLVTHGKLASGFVNRLELVKQLPIAEEIKQYFAYCLSVKLGTDGQHTYATEEMERMFLSLVSTLRKRCKVPLKNTVANLKFVVRRRLGMLKRMLQYRHLPSCGHLKRLITRLQKGEALTARDLKNNLVLNGYPLPAKER